MSDTLLLASLYSFFRGADNLRSAAAALKLAVLCHPRVTLATTMVFHDRALWQLLEQHEAFLHSGALVLDRRTSVTSFRAAALHPQFAQVDGVSTFAAYLDRVSSGHAIAYEAAGAAVSLSAMLGAHLQSRLERARSRHVRSALREALARLADVGDTFSLADASRLCADTYLAPQVANHARYFYCIVGAKAVGATAVVPQRSWQGVVRNAPAARLEGLPDRVAEADALVMNWFGLDVELLGRLTPEEVLSLKAEGLTQQYLGVLRECIAECQRRFDAHADPRAAAAEGADVLATLQAHIASRCEAERKWRFAQAGATTLVDEGVGVLVPGFGLARKGMAWIGQTMTRRAKSRTLDRSLTPMTSYVERLSAHARGRRPA